MITYEEFLKANNIENLKSLFIGKGDMLFVDAKIGDDPEQYIDVAKNAKNLEYLKLGEFQDLDYYKSLIEFIKNCREEVVITKGKVGVATKAEFLEGEEKISQIIAGINPEWSIKQKLAYTHYKMGEIISYIPDFNFRGRQLNSEIGENARNIWKAIIEGKSVCNGVVEIQRNILTRLGIKTKKLSSKTHNFLLTETPEGNIITDPTWDLSNTLYKARPQHFGVTYEELIQREEGISNSHKLNKIPENVIGISEQEVREIYYSIGLTDKDKIFLCPILQEINNINEENYSTEEKIHDFFSTFLEKFPKEALHLAETRIIVEIAIRELGLEKEQIKTKFVYSKEDKDANNPILTFYINTDNLKEKINLLDAEKMKFKELELEEFDKKYRVHDADTTEPFWKKFMGEKENSIKKEQECEK